MDVSKAIRLGLKTSGLSLTEFARRSGVSVSTAHGWAHNTHGVRTANLPKIAKALSLNVVELFA